MRLRSTGPFWPIKDGIISNNPPLASDVSCEVAIIGGGLTGAIVGHYLAEAGVDIVILDKRDIGLGSTCSSTALVPFEVDMDLVELIELRGEKFAVRSYKACLESIKKLERIVGKAGGDAGFRKKQSLYLAVSESDGRKFRREHETRVSHGLEEEFLDRRGIEANFSFSKPAGLLSKVAAEVDPYMLTHSLIDHARDGNIRAFDRTRVTKFRSVGSRAVLETDRHFRVTAHKVVFATGYETAEYLGGWKRILKLKSTYAIVTEPVDQFTGWGFDQCLIWESSRPYSYLRTTRDGRIMIGGADEDFFNPTRRDRLITTKSQALFRKLKMYFPKIKMEIGYSWAGTFGETEDSLPYIGELQGVRNAYFALCYGANGTSFAIMAGEIIRDLFLGRPNPDAQLFGFKRRV